MTFNILDHLDKLESDGGKDRRNNGSIEKSYKCPSCGGHNFLVDQTTGRYLCTANGCDNAQIRNAIDLLIQKACVDFNGQGQQFDRLVLKKHSTHQQNISRSDNNEINVRHKKRDKMGEIIMIKRQHQQQQQQ